MRTGPSAGLSPGRVQLSNVLADQSVPPRCPPTRGAAGDARPSRHLLPRIPLKTGRTGTKCSRERWLETYPARPSAGRGSTRLRKGKRRWIASRRRAARTTERRQGGGRTPRRPTRRSNGQALNPDAPPVLTGRTQEWSATPSRPSRGRETQERLSGHEPPHMFSCLPRPHSR